MNQPSGTPAPARERPAPERLPTLSVERTIRGAEDVPLDDPTETYHEASRLYPGVVDPIGRGAVLIERSPEVRATVTRSVKRHHHLPALTLPPPVLGPAQLADALARRRSLRAYGEHPLDVGALSSVVHAAYGVTDVVEGTTQALRSAPSGGALYPLELYVACGRVSGAEEALYHYDPLRHALERLRPISYDRDVASLTPYPELLSASAAMVVVTATFWRSRFKYGPRAYRFALLEAGHVGQSLLLAATALELASTPVGGFYDRLVDLFLDIDGLDEASLYLFPLGHRA
jgi:SagB-type dehydrogenase family enzyme